MKIDIQTDPDERRRPLLKTPPNYQSTRMRMRMLSLFAALVLVLVMMKEAKKPERWEWMGFEKQPPPAEVEKIKDGAKAPDAEILNSSAPNNIDVLAKLVERDDSDPADYPIAGQQFWRDTFVGFKTDDQRRLFRFLRAVNQQMPLSPADKTDFRELVNSIQKQRDRFHVRLMDQISLLSGDSKQRKRLNSELFESKDFWDNKILPAWQSTLTGVDITMSQQKANQELQNLLGELALEQVDDGSSLNRPEEGSAWLLSWERALATTNRTPTLVTHVQLSSQPSAYRGESVVVNGWIRSARKLNVATNELGFSHYYVLWVRPEDTNIGPYCVYAQQLPEGFPEVSTADIEMNERVQIPAVFFKIRTYKSMNGQVLQCPLLLANSFEWNPVSAEVAVDAWTPPTWLLVGLLVVMPIFAGLIAWWAFKSTSTPRFTHGPNAQRKIDQTLVELRKNPEIKSDLERVQSLYDNDLEEDPGDSN